MYLIFIIDIVVLYQHTGKEDWRLSQGPQGKLIVLFLAPPSGYKCVDGVIWPRKLRGDNAPASRGIGLVAWRIRVSYRDLGAGGGRQLPSYDWSAQNFCLLTLFRGATLEAFFAKSLFI